MTFVIRSRRLERSARKTNSHWFTSLTIIFIDLFSIVCWSWRLFRFRLNRGKALTELLTNYFRTKKWKNNWTLPKTTFQYKRVVFQYYSWSRSDDVHLWSTCIKNSCLQNTYKHAASFSYMVPSFNEARNYWRDLHRCLCITWYYTKALLIRDMKNERQIS